MRQIKNIVQQEKETIESLQKNIEAGRLNEHGESTTISILQSEMKRIEKDVLLDESHTSMEEQQKQWVNEHAQLDGQIIELKNRNNQLKALSEKAAREREEQQQPLENLRTLFTEKKMHVTEIEKEEQMLIGRLQEFSMAWANLHSIHDRQESIDQSIQEDIVRHAGQFEMLLADERSATRLYDDYKEQQRFFADAFLDVQLTRWQNQFTFLQTGIEFMMSVDTECALEEEYPFWAMAVVTTEKEAPILMKKLQDSQKELQFPVHILTLDEATSIVQGGRNPVVDWITPAHWTTALDNEAFCLWKEEIQKKAEAALETRKKFSSELERRKRLYEAFQHFINRYPLDYKQELELEVNELQRKEFQLSQWMTKNSLQIADYQQEVENNRNLIEKLSSEMQGFMIYLEKAKDYLEKKRKKAEHEKTRMHYAEEITAFTRQKRVERHLDEREKDLKETEDINRQTEARLAKEVIDHPLFAKVKHERAMPTDQSIIIIIEEFEEWERKVQGLLSERNVVEREMQSALGQLEGVELQIESITLAYPTILQEGIAFPSNGKEQIRTFTAQLPQLEIAKKEAEQVEREQQSKVNRQEGVVQAKQSEVTNPIEFQQVLPIENQELQSAWQTWRQAFDSLNEKGSIPYSK